MFIIVLSTSFCFFIGKFFFFCISLILIISDFVLFRYKWNFFGVSLDKRLDFFEFNWVFFVGFGIVILKVVLYLYLFCFRFMIT